MGQPRTLPGLVERMRGMVRRDWDCPIVASGYQGRGKSSLMLQLLAKVDPSFSAKRVHFTIPDFMDACREEGRFKAVLLDEALVHKRKSMTRESRDLVDFYQVNRELRQVTGLCFPHIGGLDRELAMKRVMYRFHVAARGYVVVKAPEIYSEDAEPKGVYWRPLFGFRFGPCTGDLWREYLARKNAYLRERDAEDGGEEKEGVLVDVEAALPVLDRIKGWRPPKPDRGNYSKGELEAYRWWIKRGLA